MNEQYLCAGEEKLNDRRRKLAQELTDQVKKIDRRYGVSLGWGGGNSTPTPCSDGKFVYTWRGETGILSCYELDGRCRWRRFQHTGDDAEHGFNSSPIICGNVIGLIGGARVFGFDRATGNTLWKQRYPHPCYASLVAATVGGEGIFITPVGMILRALDGAVLQKAFGQFDGECALPALEAGYFYLVARAGFCTGKLPESFQADLINMPMFNRLARGGAGFGDLSGWLAYLRPRAGLFHPQRLDGPPVADPICRRSGQTCCPL